MKPLFSIFIFLFFCVLINAQESAFFYGANGRQVEAAEKALLQKRVEKINESRYRISVSVLTGEEWEEIRTERIRMKNDGILKVRYREGTLFPRSYEVSTRQVNEGLYYFEEKKSGDIFRSGYTSSLVPLHLEGKVVEYYPGGKIRSESEYNDNMLVSNKNYYPDGTEYVHDIFYSTDEPALYSLGNDFFQKFVNARLAKHDIPVGEINDQVVIGAVVMESGELEGVHILEGFSSHINEFFRETVELLPGKWAPAKLNGEPVRSFVRFPFNFKNNDRSVHHMEMTNDGQFFMLQ